jgi:hypothetical protein
MCQISNVLAQIWHRFFRRTSTRSRGIVHVVSEVRALWCLIGAEQTIGSQISLARAAEAAKTFLNRQISPSSVKRPGGSFGIKPLLSEN